jgi:hypothetical protein
MAESILVYHVTEGPSEVLSGGTSYYEVAGVVSYDKGETCGPAYLTFETEEQALKFKEAVNSSMEPIVIGEDE